MAGHSSRPWGWYRLERSWAERLVADAGVRGGDLVLDIGAGDGALTGPLLAAGARVVAIELHPGRRAALRARFPAADLVVVAADAADLRLPRRPFRVVANPPWAVTAPLVARLLGRGSRLVRADLLLKRPAVRRCLDDPRYAGGWELRAGLTVPRRAFRPAPPIDARVLVVERRVNRRA